jgi:hypothetical protein
MRRPNPTGLLIQGYHGFAGRDSSRFVCAGVSPAEPVRLLFYGKSTQLVSQRNHFGAADLVSRPSTTTDAKRNSMTGRTCELSEQMDRPTSRSICRAIGERLRQSLRPENSELPSGLRKLMDELRHQDGRN